MASLRSISSSSFISHMLLKSAACCVVSLTYFGPAAYADTIYTWETLSETINGVSTNSLTVNGEITLTGEPGTGDPSVTTSSPGLGTPSETLTDVASASFGFVTTPQISELGPQISSPWGVIDFAATTNGIYLDILPNNSYGGFFVDASDDEAYWADASAESNILTIGYGTDNESNICYGPQSPDSSHCVVTGVFEQAAIDPPSSLESDSESVPEPGTLAIFASTLAIFGIMLPRRQRRTQPL
jgi:hypothetical protein